MQNPYFQIFAAFILAQFLMASINVYNYQKEKDIEYFKAFGAYLKAEVGYFIIGLASVLILMFILPELVDLKINRTDLLSKEKLSWKENIQVFFKCTAIVIGGFIQYIAFALKKKGKAAIDKAVDKV